MPLRLPSSKHITKLFVSSKQGLLKVHPENGQNEQLLVHVPSQLWPSLYAMACLRMSHMTLPYIESQHGLSRLLLSWLPPKYQNLIINEGISTKVIGLWCKKTVQNDAGGKGFWTILFSIVCTIRYWICSYMQFLHCFKCCVQMLMLCFSSLSDFCLSPDFCNPTLIALFIGCPILL